MRTRGYAAWGIPGVAAAALAVAFLVGAGVGGALAPTITGRPVRMIRSVPVPVKAVALTFDDGPNPVWTPQVLALLRTYGAKATFFEIGLALSRYPMLAKQEYQDGMELGNHGFRHLTLSGLDPTAIAAEVRPTEQEITAITGQRPTLYRLPKGRGDATALRTLTEMGYTVVYWSTIM